MIALYAAFITTLRTATLGAAVLIPASSTPPLTMPCELWLDACVLHQRTTFQSSQASNLLSFVAVEPLSLGRRVMEPGHLLHSALTRPSSAVARRLKSIHPFVPLHSNSLASLTTTTYVRYSGRIINGTRSGQKTPHFNSRHRYTPPEWPSQEEPGSGLTVSAPVSDGRFRSCLYMWGMASSAACECGAEKQTVDHVVLQCPIHRPLHGLTFLDDETTEWLLNTCPEI